MFSAEYSSHWNEVAALPNLAASPDLLALSILPYDPHVGALFWNEDFGSGGHLDRRILDRSCELKTSLFGGEVFAIVPLYVTSICRERCLYCNYRAANNGLKIDRIRLTDEQLEREASFLMQEKGIRVIELVYASDPKMTAEVMARHVASVRRLLDQAGGGVVAVNAEPLTVDGYRMLRDAGAGLMIVWQETYDRQRYSELHPGPTVKSNFEFRLDCFERMIEAGIPAFAMGVLSGLADWKRDWAMLMRHEAYLRHRHGRTASVLGVPRLKPAAGALLRETDTIPDDQEFLLAIALHNIFAPETRPFVSSREPWELCLRMAAGGGALFTFNCATIPGGYTLGGGGDQFPTGSYDAPLYAERLHEHGLRARFSWSIPPASVAA